MHAAAHVAAGGELLQCGCASVRSLQSGLMHGSSCKQIPANLKIAAILKSGQKPVARCLKAFYGFKRAGADFGEKTRRILIKKL